MFAVSETQHTPADRLRFALHWVMQQVTTRRHSNLLSGLLEMVIMLRLQRLERRFGRLVALIKAGHDFTPKPRPASPEKPEQPAEAPKPRAPDPLPRRREWLTKLLGEQAAQFRGALMSFIEAPETAALIEAAPRQMGRIIRPLCQMSGLQVPPSLALPRKIRKPGPRELAAKRRAEQRAETKALLAQDRERILQAYRDGYRPSADWPGQPRWSRARAGMAPRKSRSKKA